MSFALTTLSINRLAVLLGALVLSFGLALASASSIQAQSSADQTYNCGAYGAGEFGSNECLAATEINPTPLSTDAPSPTSSGLFPDTGAKLGLWAAIGAILLAIGLARYGIIQRKKRTTIVGHH